MRIDPLLTRNPVTGAVRHVTDDLLAEVCLAPKSADLDFAAVLGPGAPWSASLSAAPDETARAVAAGLEAVARATRSLDPEELRPEALPDSRARTHLAALRDLWRDVGPLPGSLGIWAHVLRDDTALEALPLLGAPCAFSAPAEAALAEALHSRFGTIPHEALPSRAPEGSALRQVQDGLGVASEPMARDDTIACFGLRDPREEAEFAAALACAMLEDGRAAAPGEIGLLVPDDPAWMLALPDAFERVGLPLSGAPGASRRDVAGEVLSLLLVILSGPAPRTALASLYVCAAMPWPVETGRQMAREVIDRGYSRTARALDGPARDVLDALRPCESAAQLWGRLGAVARALPDLPLHPRIAVLKAAMGDDLDWPLLHRLARPQAPSAEPAERFVEGVSLFPEAALPWRPVRQMIVLGMAGRHWPRLPGADPFFTEAEIGAIRETGLLLAARQQKLARGLAFLRRQLGMAREGLTLLVPARNLKGERLMPSTGLALIAHLLGAEDPADLATDLRGMDPGDWPVAAERILPLPGGGAPDLPDSGRLHIQRGLATPERPGVDLLRLRETEDGPLPHSPSRLETLLVSPLGWLLDELGAKDRTWGPETLDIMTMGTILHQVLEDSFPEGQPVTEDAALADALPARLDAALERHAAWLQDPAWAAERRSLLNEAQGVCLSWAAFLRRTGAVILHNEIGLRGQHGGLLLHGKADCLLRLPDGRILVVDHKRSGAGGRRDRMAKGWDLQVALYRSMLESPAGETPLAPLMQDGAEVVTAYHTMLDGAVLSDVPGLDGVECTSPDASGEAMAHLAQLLAEVGAGTVRLNAAGDAVAMKKTRGITAYALDNPLVAAFATPAPDDEEAAE